MNNDELAARLVALGWSQDQAVLGIRARFQCEYCGRYLFGTVEDYDAWQVNHIVPTSQGGSETDIENLALACRTCNIMKRAYPPKRSTRLAQIKDARPHVRLKRLTKQRELEELQKLADEFL